MRRLVDAVLFCFACEEGEDAFFSSRIMAVRLSRETCILDNLYSEAVLSVSLICFSTAVTVGLSFHVSPYAEGCYSYRAIPYERVAV